ncbi:MAG: hypothetical protein GXP27_11035 [Planctomycetes bacterium]|nr:hypothetical protein [Planctomycetota bacterium]
MTDWVQNADPERPFGRIGRQAFQPDADALRVELQPTDDGARLRVEFEEGFLKLIGLLLTQRLEQRLQF